MPNGMVLARITLQKSEFDLISDHYITVVVQCTAIVIVICVKAAMFMNIGECLYAICGLSIYCISSFLSALLYGDNC